MRVPIDSFGIEAVTTSLDSHASQDPVAAEVIDLFDRFRSPLLQYIGSFGFTQPDREDLIQEVFLALFRHLSQSKSCANLPAWLYRVAHNLALKRRYRLQRQSELGPEADAVDPNPGPEAAFLEGQAQQRILKVVQALPEQDRRCLYLRAEGLRYREIAEILQISLGSVSQSLTRSLARMARASER